MRGIASLILGLLLLSSPLPARASDPTVTAPAPPSTTVDAPFSRWAAVVVAGDWHAHSGGPTEAFDNARRDVSLSLAGKLGFSPEAIRQFSVRPQRYPAAKPAKTDFPSIYVDLRDLAMKNTAGCLFYLTSHGAPEGALLDDAILPPQMLAAMLDDACPARPTIVVISACFSGVFVRPLQREDRMILTAARPDRTSFGCSESDRYPYFDDCFLSSAPDAHDFAALGRAVQTCVARKERDTGAQPPSEPQLWIGAALRPVLPLYAFPRPPPDAPAQAVAAPATPRRR
jgi:hypothetical protein